MLILTEMNIVDFFIKDDEKKNIKDVLIILIGSIIMMTLSKVSFYLPFTPIPITAQSLGILVIGSSFGMKRAFFSSVVYVGSGLLGAPVFSGGKYGLQALMGPTGGYIIGFIVAASLMGFYGDRCRDRTFLSSYLIFFLGHFIIFTFGIIWLGLFVSLDRVLALGFYPFIPGMIIKTVLAGTLTPLIWKNINKKDFKE